MNNSRRVVFQRCQVWSPSCCTDGASKLFTERKKVENVSQDPLQQKDCCCPLNTGWKDSHALQVPVVILVMQRQENILLQGLGWWWLREWDGAGFTQLLHLFLPTKRGRNHWQACMAAQVGKVSVHCWSAAEAGTRGIHALSLFRFWEGVF